MRYLLILLFFPIFLLAEDAKFELGEEIYANACISCHGSNGISNKKLSFVVRPRDLSKTILDENQIYKITKYGTFNLGSYADMMPAFKSVYNETELRAVAYYIYKKFVKDSIQRVKRLYAKSDLIPKNKESEMLKRGKKVYKKNCSWCHGLDAKGDGEATKNPDSVVFPYDLTKTILTKEQMFLYAKYGGKFWGTDKDDMPSWSRKYDDYTLKSVIKYINETFRKHKK